MNITIDDARDICQLVETAYSEGQATIQQIKLAARCADQFALRPEFAWLWTATKV